MSEIPVVMPQRKNSGVERGAEFLDRLSSKERPEIVDVPGEIHESVNMGEDAILRLPGDPRAYQRGGMLVRIVKRGPTSARRMNVNRAAGALAILPYDVPSMIELLTEAARWLKPMRGKKAPSEEAVRATNAPPLAAAALLSRGTSKFPHLTCVVMGPTLRPDNSVLHHHGYDPQTGIYHDTGGVAFDPIIENPDRETALQALDSVREILNEFPFASAADESVAVAMLLTGPVRPGLPGAPLFGTSATIMGSGKTAPAPVFLDTNLG